MPRATKRTTDRPKATRKTTAARKPKGSPEFLEYLGRHEQMGEGRPKLTPQEFDKLDDELLELLDLRAEGHELTLEQDVRIQELEYLLLTPE